MYTTWSGTYCSPRHIALVAKNGGRQSPSVKVTQGSKDGLDTLGQEFENKRLKRGRKESGHQPVGKLICHAKDGRMKGRAKLMLPFPGQPSTALVSKSNVPCWFKSLEVLVWLEESSKDNGVNEAKYEEQGEDIVDLCSDNMPVRFGYGYLGHRSGW